MPGETVGTAYVEIRPKVDGFAGEVNAKITGVLNTAFAGIATGIAAQKIKSFFTDSFAEADQAVKVTAQTEAVLKSTGEQAGVTGKHIEGLAQKLSDLAAVDDEVIQQGENVLLTFTSIRNEAGKGNDVFDRATTAALNMSAALGTDLQGSIIQVGKALNDPIQGMAALRRVGVSFTESQKEQIATLQQSGDLLGAQKLILQELEKEFGGAAASQATATAKLSVAFKNLEEAVGTALLPVIDGLAKALTPLADFFAQNKAAALAFAVVLSGAVLAALVGYTIRVGQATLVTFGFKTATVEATAASESSAGGFSALVAAATPWVAVAALAVGAVVGLHTAFTNSNGTLTVYTHNLTKLTDAQLKQASAVILSEGGYGDLKNAVKGLADESESTARKLVASSNLTKGQKAELVRVIDQEVAANARAAAAANGAATATDNQTDSTKDLVDWINVVNGKLNDQVDASLGSQGAAVSMDRAIQNLNETLFTNAGNTLEVRGATIDAENSIVSFGKKIYDEKLAVSDSTQATKDQIGALSGVRDSLSPDSPLRKFLDGYIDQLNNHIPENVYTNFILRLSNETGLDPDFLRNLPTLEAALPRFAAGGWVPGPVGAPTLAVVHGGEYVQTAAEAAAGGGGGVTFNFLGGAPVDPITAGHVTARVYRTHMALAGR